MLQRLVCVLFASAVVLSLVGGDGPAAARVKVKKIIVVKGAGGDGFTPLFDGKSLKGWKTYLKDEKADPGKTFVVKDGEIQVSGEPWGYFYTEKSYKNYV